MKPASEMDSDALNREIARLRGEVRYSDEHATPILYPNYLEWANAGKLLEEMAAQLLDIWIEWRMDGCYIHWRPDYEEIYGENLPDAIRRAWWEWKVSTTP